MAQTHDLGNFFLHSIELKRGTPIFHRAPTQEIEEPYRISNSLVVRLFGSYGVVLGRWKAHNDEDSALEAATGYRPIEKWWEDDEVLERR